MELSDVIDSVLVHRLMAVATGATAGRRKPLNVSVAVILKEAMVEIGRLTRL